MCYDTYYGTNDGYCQYGCCDEHADTFCCKYVGPFFGIIIAASVLLSVVVITICCCRRQNGAPGIVLSPGVINRSTIIDTCSMKDCSGKYNTEHSLTSFSDSPPPYDSLSCSYPGAEKMVPAYKIEACHQNSDTNIPIC